MNQIADPGNRKNKIPGKNSWTFIASSIFLLFLVFFSLYWFQEQRDSSNWIDHTYIVKFHIEKSQSILTELESSQRAYLLTKNPYYISFIKSRRIVLDSNMNALRGLISDNPVQISNNAKLKELIDARVERLLLFLDSSVRIDQFENTGGLGRGQQLMDSARIQAGIMLEKEDQLLHRRIANKERLDTNVTLFIVLFAVISLVSLFLSFLRIKTENLRRLKAEVDVELLEARVKERTIEIQKINQELVIQNNKLERKNQDLASFTHIASHDLKEPLRKIDMFTNKIIQTNGTEMADRFPEYLKKISAQSTRMQNLIEAVLQYAQTEGEFLDYQNTDLNILASQAVESLSEAIQLKKAGVVIGKLPHIFCIPETMEQVFVNLIGNAIKYSKQDQPPVIEISAGRIKSENIDLEGFAQGWKIDFIDNGIGFEEKYAPKIFEIFQRLHDRNSYSGTGIGLAICKKIVEQHGGKIMVKSVPGQGSIFSVILPANLT